MASKGLARDCPRCGSAVAAKATACSACGASLERARRPRRRSVRAAEAGPGTIDEEAEWPEERHHLDEDEYEAFLAREFGAGERGRRRGRRALWTKLGIALLLVLLLLWALRL